MKLSQAGAIAAAAVAAVILVAFLTSSDSTPIREQSCAELAETMRALEQRVAEEGLDPNDLPLSPPEAFRDVIKVGDRQRALGGCPDEPALH